MSKRKAIKTKKAAIISYWAAHQDECGLSIDWSEADERCWRCGTIRPLDRCHIIPASLGGKDAPENLVLLCKMCHAEGPNVADSDVMWDWIRAYGVPFYDTFWKCKGMKEYKFIYKHSFGHAVKYIMESSKVKMNNDELIDYIEQEVENVAHQSSIHYGQYYWNTMTYAGNYRRIIKAFAKQMGVDIKQLDESIREDDNNVWWAGGML